MFHLLYLILHIHTLYSEVVKATAEVGGVADEVHLRRDVWRDGRIHGRKVLICHEIQLISPRQLVILMGMMGDFNSEQW